MTRTPNKVPPNFGNPLNPKPLTLNPKPETPNPKP